jgi:hypothetical protein
MRIHNSPVPMKVICMHLIVQLQRNNHDNDVIIESIFILKNSYWSISNLKIDTDLSNI